MLVADIEELETMDASDIYSKRLNAKEVIFPKENGELIFPITDGRIKTLGGDQELRTSTLIRPRPSRGEGHIDFFGESEGSLPPPHDSFPDAGEAINDFWSMSRNFIYRHHVEPRVKLYSPREESFPYPLKYIDVSRTTHTNLDVKQEKRIDDYWNVDGSRDLTDPWSPEEKVSDGCLWSGRRLTRKQLTSSPDHLWPELWKKMGKNAKLKEKQKWSNEKLHLENARKLRGIYRVIGEIGPLVGDEIPVHGNSHASSSREPSLEPTPTRSVDLGKHSVQTHFSKDRNCEIYKRTKIGPRAEDAMAELWE